MFVWKYDIFKLILSPACGCLGNSRAPVFSGEAHWGLSLHCTLLCSFHFPACHRGYSTGFVSALQPIEVTYCSLSQCREHVDLENLRGEHVRLLEEAKKEKVPFFYFLMLPLPRVVSTSKKQLSSRASFFSLSRFFHQLLLNNQLEMVKMKVEQEKKKCYLAHEALKEKVEDDFFAIINVQSVSSHQNFSNSTVKMS